MSDDLCQCPKCGRVVCVFCKELRKDAIRDIGHLAPALVTQLQRSVERNAKMANALRALFEWYDRDGSVGGASEVFENNRKALTGATDE